MHDRHWLTPIAHFEQFLLNSANNNPIVPANVSKIITPALSADSYLQQITDLFIWRHLYLAEHCGPQNIPSMVFTLNIWTNMPEHNSVDLEQTLHKTF